MATGIQESRMTAVSANRPSPQVVDSACASDNECSANYADLVVNVIWLVARRVVGLSARHSSAFPLGKFHTSDSVGSPVRAVVQQW